MGNKQRFLQLSLAASLGLLPHTLLADAFVTLEGVTLLENQLTGIGEAKLISKETLERTQAKEMKDIFANEPTISIGGGGRNAQRIYLRGIEGTNLNITIDGAKQGGSLFQHMGDIGGIDPNLLKSVEVSTVAGADKGSGALGGSIVFETVDAQDLLEKGQDLGASLRGGYYSASEGYSGGISIYGKASEHVGILFDASGVSQEDYRTGGGDDALNTAVDDRNYFLKFSLLDYYDHSFKVGATHNKNDGYYISGSAGSDMGVPDPTKATSHMISTRDTYTIDHRYNPQSSWIDLKTNLYLNERNLENKTSGMDVTSKNTGGNIKNNTSFETGSLNHLYTIGGDYNVEDGITKGKPTNTSKTVGLFMQGNTNYSALTLNYGVRYDDYAVDYGTNKTFNGHEFSPNLGLDYQIIEGLNAFINYSESIKIGSIIPIQWLSNTTASTKFNGSLDGIIKPETSEQIEGGVRYKTKGVLTPDDRLTLGGTLFQTTIVNLIEKSGPQGTINEIYNNPLDVISEGYELKASWENKQVRTSLGFVHVDTEDENGNAIMNTRRKAGAIGDTIVWDNTWGITNELKLGYTLTSVSKFDDVPAGAVVRPSYILHDVQVQYKPNSVKGLTLSLALNNIFDKEYFEQTSIEGSDDTIQEEVGRDIRASFKYVF